MADDVARLSIQIDSSGVVKASSALDGFSKQSEKAENKTKRFRGVIGGLGFQIQDIAVQLQGGQNALLVFGQQGSQIASLFGPGGAVVGAFLAVGAAIGTALVPSLFGANKELQEFEDRMKSVQDRLSLFQLRAVNEDIKRQQKVVDDLRGSYALNFQELRKLSGADLPAPPTEQIEAAQKKLDDSNAVLSQLIRDRNRILRGEQEKLGIGAGIGDDPLIQRAEAAQRGEQIIFDIEDKERQRRLEAARQEVLDRVSITKAMNQALQQEAFAQAEFEAKQVQIAKDKQQARNNLDTNILASATNVAGQLTSVIEQTSGKQSAAYKAAFLAQQAFAIASTLVNTELAATAALAPPPLGLGPLAGLPYSQVIRGLGYTSAALIAAQTVVGLKGRALGGQVSGPVLVGERGPELFVPGNQRGNIITNEKMRSMGGDATKITIVNNTSAKIGNVVEQRISDTERVLIIQEAVDVMSAQLSNPNSRPSRAISQNTNARRAR